MKLPFLSRFFSSSPSKGETASPEDSGAAANNDAQESSGSDDEMKSEIDRLFDDSSLAHGDPPRAVILMGPIATGKTTMRIKEYSHGFVLIDAAEMFHHMSRDNAFLDFPDAFLEPLATIGPIIARRAVAERRHIVTEIVGADYMLVDNLVTALRSTGYTVEVVAVMCDLEEALRRNENRGDNVSAYYAEQFQRQWIIDACRGTKDGLAEGAQQQAPKPATTTPQLASNPGATPEMSQTYTNSIGMEFALIPAGEFLMGSDKGKDPEAHDDETPLHRVTISRPFYLGKYAVTQAQWEAVMGSNPSYFKGRSNPVETVSWDDVQKFIWSLNIQEGNGCYRLPTEAEWEYACRAGTTGVYSYGDDAGSLGHYAWYAGNSGKKPHPVGQKEPNAWGLYDMHGNVWEWVQDWYDDYSSASVTDPKGPASGSYRVLRGGGWGLVARYCRSEIGRASCRERV
jgi:formylglycine-generating enzyme required for sulfatase activity